MPKLTVDVEARLAQFQDALTAIGNAGDRTARRISSAFSGLKGTLAALGVGLSAAGLTAFFKSGVDQADQLGKLAEKVGITVESLSALKHAAELSDVSIEQLQVGLQQLAKHAQEAQSGAGEAADTFKALGISVKDAGGNLKPTEELLLAVAERFARMEAGAGKTALAMRVFGRSGADLIPLLNQGRDGIDALRKEAERLGIILSADTARAAEQFNDDLKRLGSSSDALKFKLAEDLLPALNRVAKALLDAKLEGEGFMGMLKALGKLSPATDLFKAEREVDTLTSELLATQNEIMRRRGTATKEEIDALDEHAERLEKRLHEVIRLRGVLSGETDMFGGPVTPKKPPAKDNAPALPDTSRDKAALDAYVSAYEKVEVIQREAWDAAVKMEELIKKRQYYEEIYGEEVTGTTEELKERLKYQLEGIDAMRGLEEVQMRIDAGFDEFGNVIKKDTKLAEDLGFTFASAFENAIVEGEKLRDVLKGLAQDILRIFVRKAVTEPLAGMLASAFTGAFGGAKATQHGGRRSAGELLMVGERGPELWIPDSSGTMIPNDRLGTGAGGVSIVQNIHVDARSDIASVREAMRAAKDEAVAAVRDQVNRGGGYAAAFRG